MAEEKPGRVIASADFTPVGNPCPDCEGRGFNEYQGGTIIIGCRSCKQSGKVGGEYTPFKGMDEEAKSGDIFKVTYDVKEKPKVPATEINHGTLGAVLLKNQAEAIELEKKEGAKDDSGAGQTSEGDGGPGTGKSKQSKKPKARKKAKAKPK